jgi:hypothetical protein
MKLQQSVTRSGHGHTHLLIFAISYLRHRHEETYEEMVLVQEIDSNLQDITI